MNGYSVWLMKSYDPASETDFVYCRYAKQFQTVPKAAKTSGSSTTVTENTSGDATFAAVGVGDLLYNPANGNLVRVTAKASDASITVSSAVNWAAGTNINVLKFQSGSTGSDGWVGIDGADRVTVHIEVATLASASATFVLETRMAGMNSSQILTPAAFTAVTVASTTGSSSYADVIVAEGAEAFRLGVKVATDATDVVSAAVRIEYAS